MLKLSEKQQTPLLKIIDLITPITTLILLASTLSVQWHDHYLIATILSTFMLYIFSSVKNLYKPLTQQNLFEYAITVVGIWFIIITTIVTVAFIYNEAQNFSHTFFVIWGISTPILLITLKSILKKIIYKPETHILSVGSQYQFTPFEQERLKKANITLHKLNEQENIEKTKQLINDTLHKQSIKAILLNTSQLKNETIHYQVQKKLNGIKIYTLDHFMEEYLRKCYIPTGQQQSKYLEKIKPYNKRQLLIKTIIDYSGAIILLITSIPVILYAIYKIKKESPGTILFKQKRVGINGKEFTLIKFRSMHMNAEKDGARFAKQDDPRAYEFGKFMRKTRIDELPQIFNVLKGDIHLIGPRAERRIFTEKLERVIPYYNERHIVKPGITGWAQVNYPYGSNTEDARQKLMYDLYYIKYWTLALEIETAWKTIEVILKKRGV